MPKSSNTDTNGSNQDETSATSPPGTIRRSGRKKKRDADDDDQSSVGSASIASRSHRKRKKDDDDSDISVEVKKKRKRKTAEVGLDAVDEDAVMEGNGGGGQKEAANDNGHSEEHKISGELNVEIGGEHGPLVTTQQQEQQQQHQEQPAEPNPSPPPVETSTLQHLAQGLRLPSQQTPKPQQQTLLQNSQSYTPVPPGGRRLFFETAKKKRENKLLLDLRRQIEEQGGQNSERLKSGEREQLKQSGQMEMEQSEEEVTSSPTSTKSPLQFQEVSSGGAKTAFLSYFFVWVVVLLSFFIVVNVSATFSEDGETLELLSNWNVLRNVKLKSSHLDHVVLESDDNATIEKPQEIIENVVQMVDPTLLTRAKETIQTQRKEEYELKKLDSAIERAHKDLDTIASLVKDLSSSSPSMVKMLSSEPHDPSSLEHDVDGFNLQLNTLYSSIAKRRNMLSQWEETLIAAEKMMDQFDEGEIDQTRMNAALNDLSKSSMMGVSPRVLDTYQIIFPGESCTEKDYVASIAQEDVTPTQEEEIDVVGGIDVEALDYASDVPVRVNDAHAVFASLMNFVNSTATSLIGQSGPSARIQQWIHHWIQGEWKKEGLDKPTNDMFEPLVIAKDKLPSGKSNAYTVFDSMNDIDRLLEIESADRTGLIDYASVVHGARVLHRGPYTTSPSLYESLPVLNRLLAYAQLRFYGHPPEVALLPSSTYGRGQCWSFVKERRRDPAVESRGDYATLTVSLSSPIAVTEVVVEHLSSGSSGVTSAVKSFRVLGFEDGGAFGVPWELGSFQYETSGKFSMQRFSIPTTLNGVVVPKLKAVSLAVDSNWGADFSCLYRFRVHG
ncbi:hypothetical protein ACHAW6_009554 [Cyclotella cf. meneghiniana]